MALVIRRRLGPPGTERRPRLLLVGGDGRWARPLLRLVDSLGFSTVWFERHRGDLEPRGLEAHDLVLAGDPDAARWVLAHCPVGRRPPVVIMTGSLLGLSTAISGYAATLPLPVTRESLAKAIERGRGTDESAA